MTPATIQSMEKMNNKNSGKVYLIGAGPGDPGLITVKGNDLLYSCDAVIYDNLVPDELVVRVPRGTEMFYVGKKPGDHPVPQEDINELMLRLAREGKKVARLKGSDPLIFGRGGEEAKFLKEHGIEFEIVTGVTAGVAAPSYCGIPCTDREKASFVLFVTGHKASKKMQSSVPWDWVAGAKNGTIVVYMGVREIRQISGRLLKSGMPDSTPAAIIERGTFPSQRLITSTLNDVADVAEENDVKPPALFVFGEVVKLQPWLEWFTDRPLLGLRIMVTRSADQAGPLYKRMRELGAEPMPLPTIAIEEQDDPEGWKKFKNISGDNDWLIFTSENGVRCFFSQFGDRIGDIRHLGHFKIAAIGIGTARELKTNRLTVDYIPSKATVEDLAAEMPQATELANTTIVRIRGNLAGDTIEKEFPKHGATVLPLTVYRNYHPTWPVGLKDKMLEHPPHAILFTSGSSVKGIYHNLKRDEADKTISDAEIFSIGPKVTQTLKDERITLTREAEKHNIDGLIASLLDFYKNK